MTTREDVLNLLYSSQHAPLETHSPIDGACQECPWPLHALSPEDITDALIAQFPHLIGGDA